jgi:hypothetical protein
VASKCDRPIARGRAARCRPAYRTSISYGIGSSIRGGFTSRFGIFVQKSFFAQSPDRRSVAGRGRSRTTGALPAGVVLGPRERGRIARDGGWNRGIPRSLIGHTMNQRWPPAAASSPSVIVLTLFPICPPCDAYTDKAVIYCLTLRPAGRVIALRQAM